MKKKIITGIAALALAAVVGINVKMNSQDNQMTDIALANVEALAQGSENYYPIDLPVAEIYCTSGNYGRCSSLQFQEGLFGSCWYYCDWSGNTNDYCSWWRELIYQCGAVMA